MVREADSGEQDVVSSWLSIETSGMVAVTVAAVDVSGVSNWRGGIASGSVCVLHEVVCTDAALP